MYKNNDCTKNIQTGKNVGPSFKLEDQVQEKVYTHE